MSTETTFGTSAITDLDYYWKSWVPGPVEFFGMDQAGKEYWAGLLNTSSHDYVVNRLTIYYGTFYELDMNNPYFDIELGIPLSYNQYIQFPVIIQNNTYPSEYGFLSADYHFFVQNLQSGEEYEIRLFYGVSTWWNLDSSQVTFITTSPLAKINLSTNIITKDTTVNIVFSETINDLTISDFVVYNGTLSNLATNDNINWTAILSPTIDLGVGSINLGEGTYTDNSGESNKNVSVVNFTVTHNTPPVSSNTAITINEDTAEILTLSNFGFGDVDTSDNLSKVKISTLPNVGSLKLNGMDVTLNQEIAAGDINAGKLIFTPAANANGTAYASFGFKVSDGLAYSTSAYTVIMYVTAVNDTPTISASVTLSSVAEDSGTITITQAQLLANASDVDGNVLSITGLSTSTGALVENGNNTWTLTPAANYNGTIAFSYNVTDGIVSTATTATQILSAVNDAPTSTNTTTSTNKATLLTTALPTAIDIDGDSVSYALTNNAYHGTAIVQTNGSYTYTPDTDFSGIDLFSYSVSDGNGGSNSYSVKVDVIETNIASIPTTALANFSDVAKLYVATFNRAPDAAGLEWWVYSSGLGIEQIAQSFFDQPETKSLYPTGTSNTSFVVSVYDNLFNRSPDQAGQDYWVHELDTGNIAKQNFILAVMNGALDTSVSLDKTILENKMNIGLFFAQEGLNDVTYAKSVMEYVDATVASVEDSLGIIMTDVALVGINGDVGEII